jgi:ABC-type multidrug transport system fused ATPase/permease subunit
LVSVVSLALALFREKKWALAMAGMVGLVFIALFGIAYVNLIGVGITAILFIYARQSGIEEIDQRTKINSRMIARRAVPAVIMSFFVLVSFAAFQSPVAKGIAEAEQLPLASQQLMRSIIDSVIDGQIEASGQEKENIINQVSNETFKQINNILKPYFQYAPPLLAFGLFLILWGLNWIFVWLSVLLGVGIFWLLRRTGFVRIEERDIKAEVLII